MARVARLPVLLQVLGLEIINALRRNWRAPEASKVVLTRSPGATSAHAAIHIVPMTSLAALIYCNYHTLYIGPYFTRAPQNDAIFLAIIQVAAKAQELLCVASLAAVLLQVLRRELLGDGIPIGLLGSGIWFSQISSLWSPDFLGAARWSMTSWRRAQLYALIVLAGAIAAVIGPAAAVLLLPRYQDIPAGSTTYYLDGTAIDFWPDTVYGSSEPQLCTYSNSTMYAICPSGG